MGRILWLASYPKSGNTWLRAFLHNLLRNPDQPYDINRLSDLSASDSKLSLYAPFTDRPVHTLDESAILALRPKVQAALAERAPDVVIVKTHNALVQYRNAPLIRPDLTGGAVYVVRDPRDVALSFADHNGWTLDETIEAMARRYVKPTTGRAVLEVYGSWSDHVLSWTRRPDRFLHVVRYEDMLHRPLATFRAVAGFLGVKPSRDRLDRAIKASSFTVLQAQEQAHGFVERTPVSARFFRVGRDGQWRHAMSEAQARRIVEVHGEVMARFGYRPEPG